MKMISDWIMPNKKIIYNQIYKASRDEGTGKSFHSHCYFKGPTLTLMKAKSGHVFGGYVTVSWESFSEFRFKCNDKYAFVFSVNNRKKYPVTC